jgi:hypothetical protein
MLECCCWSATAAQEQLDVGQSLHCQVMIVTANAHDSVSATACYSPLINIITSINAICLLGVSVAAERTPYL